MSYCHPWPLLGQVFPMLQSSLSNCDLPLGRKKELWSPCLAFPPLAYQLSKLYHSHILFCFPNAWLWKNQSIGTDIYVHIYSLNQWLLSIYYVVGTLKGLSKNSHELMYPVVCWWDNQRESLDSRSTPRADTRHKNSFLKSAELSTGSFSCDVDLKNEKELVVCLLWFEHGIFPHSLLYLNT